MTVSDDELEQAWQAGQVAWPGLELARDRFAARIGELNLRFASDLYLAAACLEGNPAAIAAFERDMLASARKAIEAIDGSPAFVDEALQRLRESLLVGGEPRLATYAGRGALRAWVGIAGARHALMLRRSQKRAREVSPPDDDWIEALVTISTNNPELELLKQQYAAAFSVALREAVAALEPRLRAVLRMSFIDDVSIDQIAAVYSVHRATAARWIQRACDTVFATTRELLAKRLKLSASELDRMTALVRSQLEVSLSQLLPALDISADANETP
jgi:RNA polymerase sigma-70 factor (ECF subfamily)